MYSKSTVSSHEIPQSIQKISHHNDPYNYSSNGQFNQFTSINKLPNNSYINLGQYPQIVILFQAAQIQRLNNIIINNRILNKGVKKQYLDRHSYQIQIKQLTILLDELKQQNKGLKKRIKQLNNQITLTNIKSNNANDVGILSNKYQRALLQIGKMYDDNTKLQQQLNQLHYQISQLKCKNINSNMHIPTYINNINQQQKNKIIQQTTQHLRNKISQIQLKNIQIIHQLQSSFNTQIFKYQSLINQNNFNKQQLQQLINKLNHKIQGLNVQLLQNNKQKQKLYHQVKQNHLKLQQYQNKIYQHQLSFNKYISQINQLNDKINQLQNSSYSPHTHEHMISLTLSRSQQKAIYQSFSSQKQNKPSILSTINHINNNQKFGHEQLQNYVAMLSQQVQRLDQLLKTKNIQLTKIQNQYKEQRINNQKQFINIRIQYQNDLRKQQQKRNQLQQQLTKQTSKNHKNIQQYQNLSLQNITKYKNQLITIKQQQRKICQSIYNKKIKLLQQEYENDKNQIISLKKQIKSLYSEIDNIHQNQINLQSEKKIKQLKYLSKMQQSQQIYQNKIKNLQEEWSQKNEQKYHNLTKKYQQQLTKLQQKLSQQAQIIRLKQLQHHQQLTKISNKYTQNLHHKSTQKQTIQQNYQKLIKQKQKQLLHLSSIINNNHTQGQSNIRKIQQILNQKIDHINQSIGQAKNRMIQAINTNKTNPTIGESQLSRIRSNLQHISSQILTLSKQIMQAILDQLPPTPSQSQTPHNDQYIKQLKNECQNYLTLINNKINTNDIVLNNIWQQIEQNNRFNRNQQDKWKHLFNQRQHIIQQYHQDQIILQSFQLQNQRKNYQFKRDKLGQIRKIQQQHQQSLQNLTTKYQNQLHKSHQKISQLTNQLTTKQTIISQYIKKLNNKILQQNQSLSKLFNLLQIKNRQFQQLSSTIQQYKNKYGTSKNKLYFIENIIEKLIKDSTNDLINIDKLQQENISLRKQLQKLLRQLSLAHQQKQKLLQKSQQQLSKLAQQLTSQTLLHKQQLHQQHTLKTNKILHLQQQFNKLLNIIHKLKQDNYQLTQHNYNQSIQDHIQRQFSITKIRQLNKQIQRLIIQNIDLKDDISRCRLQLNQQWDQQKRNQQNLALIVLLVVEIQCLRKRVHHQQQT